MMRNLIFLFMILSSVISLGQGDILKTINETEELSIVAGYIQLSGLDQTLSGKGPFTFFAPTDDAFMKLPELTRANLINDVVRLQRVLKYHIIQGKFSSSMIVQRPNFVTLLGQTLSVDAKGGIKVDGSSILIRDIEATNGIIHIIDSVIFPHEEPDIVQVMRNTGILDTAVFALEKTGVIDILKGETLCTVFMPSDVAFARLPSETMENLFRDPARLRDILLFHIVEGSFSVEELFERGSIRSLLGETIVLGTTPPRIGPQKTVVILSDIEASNGMINIVDHVMFHEDSRTKLSTIEETLKANGIDIMAELLKRTGICSELSENKRLTVFAPTNEAFLELKESDKAFLYSANELRKVLEYHILPNEYLLSELKISNTLLSLIGKPLHFEMKEDLLVNSIPIVESDILCSNGVIHIIESLLVTK